MWSYIREQRHTQLNRNEINHGTTLQPRHLDAQLLGLDKIYPHTLYEAGKYIKEYRLYDSIYFLRQTNLICSDRNQISDCIGQGMRMSV